MKINRVLPAAGLAGLLIVAGGMLLTDGSSGPVVLTQADVTRQIQSTPSTPRLAATSSTPATPGGGTGTPSASPDRSKRPPAPVPALVAARPYALIVFGCYRNHVVDQRHVPRPGWKSYADNLKVEGADQDGSTVARAGFSRGTEHYSVTVSCRDGIGYLDAYSEKDSEVTKVQEGTLPTSLHPPVDRLK